jgi:hypothetical protein
MRTTLRRKTKAFDAALLAAKPGQVRCYSLNNCFTGVTVDSFDRWTPRKELEQFNFAKLHQSGNKITLSVHSNLWYEWDIT